MVLIPLLLLACTSEQTVVEEMERALYASHAAIAVDLMSTELLMHTLEEPDNLLRHGSSCGCPCIDKVGETAPFVLTLEYQDAGCLPESALIPSSMAGTSFVDWDGVEATVTFEGLEVGLNHPVSGSLSGVPTADFSSVVIQADLSVGDYDVVLEGTTDVDTNGVTMNGTADVGGEHSASMQLNGLSLPWDQIPPPCPSPSGGTVIAAGDEDVEVAFSKAGDGLATVTRKNRVSEEVDYCAYRTDLF